MSWTGSLVPPFPWEINTFPDHQHFPSGKFTTFHKHSWMHLLLVVQSVKSYPTLCNPMDCSTPGFPDLHYSWSLLKLVSIESVMPPNHLIFCCLLLLLPSIFPSIMVFSNDLAFCIRWPKYWSFSISRYNEYSRWISFRIDWFDLFAVQGTLKSLLQHHSLKASIIWCSAFFMAQFSHPYMTTEKIIALIIWTFAGKYCLCFLIQCQGLS